MTNFTRQINIWPGRLVAFLFMVALIGSGIGAMPTGCQARADSDTIPTDFCYRFEVAVTNSTGGAITN